MFFFFVATDGAVHLIGTLIKISASDTVNMEFRHSLTSHKNEAIFNDRYKVSSQIKSEKEKPTIASRNSIDSN